MRHIVMFSGGVGSWATARRVVDKHGAAHVTLLFADVAGDRHRCGCGHLDDQHINGRGPCDVKSDGTYCGCTRWEVNTHAGEDEDTYRFIEDAAANLGAELVRVKDPKGRDVWSTFTTRRFLGNSRQANCSETLKQKPCRAWLKANCDPASTTVYVGIDWSEEHRIPAIEAAYAKDGYRAVAPMCEPPYMDKQQMIDWATSQGLTPPRAYALGFPHNNCGGFCVRAGKAQFKKLLEVNRDRYMFHEAREQEFRDYIGKPVTILTEASKSGQKVGLTLRGYRERIESQGQLFALGEDDEFDYGGCGCFTQGEVE